MTPRLHAFLNIIGATLAAVASWLISYMPFVVLEGTWAVVAVWAFVRAGRTPPAAPNSLAWKSRPQTGDRLGT
jgi:hypothetical protein